MPDSPPGMSAAVEPKIPRDAAARLRRCPGCHNQVTMQTPVCPVCGKHAVVARVLSAVRWAIIVGGAAVLIWWGARR